MSQGLGRSISKPYISVLARDLWEASQEQPDVMERIQLANRLFGAHTHAVKFKGRKNAFLDGLPDETKKWIKKEMEKVNRSYSGEDPIVDLNENPEDVQTLAQIVQAIDEGTVIEGMYPHPDAIEWGLRHRR